MLRLGAGLVCALACGSLACSDPDGPPIADAGALDGGVDAAVPDCPAQGATDRDDDGHRAICLRAGELVGGDCDDGDPLRFPGNREVCDQLGKDEDCDPESFGDLDRDEDGFVDARCCNGGACGPDCHDLRADVYPQAPEVCDGFDNDCDGETDEGVTVMRFRDADHDGHGERGGERVAVCEGTAGFSELDDDCDDESALRHPEMPEICDLVDNDCDGEPERPGEAQEIAWYLDGDEDGFGQYIQASVSCAPPPFPVVCNNDVGRFVCFPGKGPAPEPNMSQHHVEGQIGFAVLRGDCQDIDQSSHPGAEERCDGSDNDCDGRPDYRLAVNDFEDDDGDLQADAQCEFGRDCDDLDPLSGDGREEICDHFDNDCDGEIDEDVESARWYPDRDGDGFGDGSRAAVESCGFVAERSPFPGDCDDRDPDRRPRVRERCNAVDDDCDELIDEMVTPCGAVSGLSGRVLRRADSAPLAGALVEVFDVMGGSLAGAQTDEEGRFAFDVPAGPVTVSVAPPGGSDGDGLVGLTRVALAPADQLELRLDPAERFDTLAEELGTSWDHDLALLLLQVDGVSPLGGQGALLAPDSGTAVARVGTTTAPGGLLPGYEPPLPTVAGRAPAEVSYVSIEPGVYAVALSDRSGPNGLGMPNCTLVDVPDVGDPAARTGAGLTVPALPLIEGRATMLRVDCTLSLGNCCTAHGGQGCTQPEIEGCVCEAEPTCCEPDGFDAACAALVSEAGCSSCPAVVPDGGDCCSALDTIGCGSATIEDCVCRIKPDCCVGLWESDCAGTVWALRCGLCPLRQEDGGLIDAGR